MLCPPGSQSLDNIRANPPFHSYLAWKVLVWPERVGKVPSRDTGRFCSQLRIHPELDNVEEDLRHRLALGITTWSAERHERLALFECRGRIGGQEWTFAGL